MRRARRCIEFETFLAKYPNSPLMPEVQARYREARDRLSMSEYRVGYFYFRQRWYPGAIARLKAVLKEDPGFSQRDALYYYLGEALLKVKLDAEALPYFDRLVKEFETSEFLEPAKARLAEFKETPAATPAAATGEATGPPANAAPPRAPLRRARRHRSRRHRAARHRPPAGRHPSDPSGYGEASGHRRHVTLTTSGSSASRRNTQGEYSRHRGSGGRSTGPVTVSA